MNRPNAAGEQIQTEYFSVADSPIKVGDECIFRVRPPGRPQEYLGQLTGTVLEVLPGYELVYAVRVHAGQHPWPTWFVSMYDIAPVRW